MSAASRSELDDSRWHGLFRLGGMAAFIIAALLLGEIAVYALIPTADTALERLALFRDNWLVGLLSLDLLGMISYVLFVPLIIALYMSLRRTNQTAIVVATAVFFVGIADFFATNTAFPLLSLSRQYAAAATDAERAMFLSAGQAMLTLFNENAFLVSYVIVSTAWLMISAVMLRSSVFGKLASCAGIAAGGSGIAAVALEHVSAIHAFLVLAISLYFAAIVLLFIWVFLVGLRLRKLGQERLPVEVAQ